MAPFTFLWPLHKDSMAFVVYINRFNIWTAKWQTNYKLCAWLDASIRVEATKPPRTLICPVRKLNQILQRRLFTLIGGERNETYTCPPCVYPAYTILVHTVSDFRACEEFFPRKLARGIFLIANGNVHQMSEAIAFYHIYTLIFRQLFSCQLSYLAVPCLPVSVPCIATATFTTTKYKHLAVISARQY